MFRRATGNDCYVETFLKKSPRILLVEDNPSDARLVELATKRSPRGTQVDLAGNGESALRRLADPEKPPPDLILLDLNMPVMNGFEFLKRVKTDESTRNIPVIVLTTSNAPGDVKSAYDLHANAYLVKDLEFEEFVETMASLENFWFGQATLAHE